MANRCRICSSRDTEAFTAYEMMFGSRDAFLYFACGACGCLQIADIPEDLSAYYPDAYYAYDPLMLPPMSRWTRWAYGKRIAQKLGNRSLAGRVLARGFSLFQWMHWVRRAGIGPYDAVLDVGSGTGRLLLEMYKEGFTDLTGIDPFLEADIQYAPGFRVLKKTLAQVDGSYDFVMLHHTFEHLPAPVEALQHIARLVKPGRFVLIRIPVADSHAWRTYGADWVQLDAPRHLFLHTQQSMELLAKETGFRIVRVQHDSRAFQFMGSELYRRGIPLREFSERAANPEQGGFSEEQIQAWEAEAKRLNQAGDGDQACFYLQRI